MLYIYLWTSSNATDTWPRYLIFGAGEGEEEGGRGVGEAVTGGSSGGGHASYAECSTESRANCFL